MAYGTDVTVFVEDIANDHGGQLPGTWWLSPDVDIPAHPGLAVQGTNQVQVRVHAHEEPFLEDKVTAEVYVGAPGFVLSPTTGTRRIDPGNLLFRTAEVAGSEPLVNETGATLTFPWVPSADADIDGPGHRCLIVRAFPTNVTPDPLPFNVPNEPHEAQHNIEVVSTQMSMAPMAKGGAGTPDDPRRRDEETGMWWERFATMAAGRIGTRFIVWAFDPEPGKAVVGSLRRGLGEGFKGFSKDRPKAISLEAVEADGGEIDPSELFETDGFAESAGLGRGLWEQHRLVGAAKLALEPDNLAGLLLRFDHSNIEPGTAVVLHGVQWNERGDPEGGMTVVALSPTGSY
jgi:hypothetical protein